MTRTLLVMVALTIGLGLLLHAAVAWQLRGARVIRLEMPVDHDETPVFTQEKFEVFPKLVHIQAWFVFSYVGLFLMYSVLAPGRLWMSCVSAVLIHGAGMIDWILHFEMYRKMKSPDLLFSAAAIKWTLFFTAAAFLAAKVRGWRRVALLIVCGIGAAATHLAMPFPVVRDLIPLAMLGVFALIVAHLLAVRRSSESVRRPLAATHP